MLPRSSQGVSSNTPPLHDKPENETSPNAISLLSLMPDWVAGSSTITLDHLQTALDYLCVPSPSSEYLADAPLDLLPPYPFVVKYRPTRQDVLIVHCEDYWDVRVQRFGSVMRATITAYSRPVWERGWEVLGLMQTLALVLFGSDLTLAPSRLDMCADVVRFDLRSIDTNNLRDTFLTRSFTLGHMDSEEQETESGNNRAQTVSGRTLYIGGPKSSAPLKLYEKSAELRHKPKDYYLPPWLAGGYDSVSSVVRIEYSLRRKSLANLLLPSGEALASILQLEECFVALWQAALLATRMVKPDATETNRSRLETSALWVLLMQAQCSLGTVAAVYDLTRVQSRRHNRVQLEKQLVGVMVTYASLAPGAEDADRSGFLASISGMFDRFEAENGPMGASVRKRRLKRMIALY